jgi:hypothetical protein
LRREEPDARPSARPDEEPASDWSDASGESTSTEVAHPLASGAEYAAWYATRKKRQRQTHEQMVAQHKHKIEMARLTLKRAEAADNAMLARDEIADLEQRNAQLRADIAEMLTPEERERRARQKAKWDAEWAIWKRQDEERLRRMQRMEAEKEAEKTSQEGRELRRLRSQASRLNNQANRILELKMELYRQRPERTAVKRLYEQLTLLRRLHRWANQSYDDEAAEALPPEQPSVIKGKVRHPGLPFFDWRHRLRR